jgi:hypothetical protein
MGAVEKYMISDGRMRRWQGIESREPIIVVVAAVVNRPNIIVRSFEEIRNRMNDILDYGKIMNESNVQHFSP